MIRQTSIDAYNKIKENGLLSKRRQEVYEIIFKHGPLTSGECYGKFRIGGGPLVAQTRARVTELHQMGVIEEIGKRDCEFTGQNALVWRVTNKLPVPLPKQRPRKDKKKDVLNLLRELYKVLGDRPAVQCAIVEISEKIKGL